MIIFEFSSTCLTDQSSSIEQHWYAMIGHEVPPAETPETIFQVEFPKGEHINVRLRARALHIRRRWRVVWTMVIGGSTCTVREMATELWEKNLLSVFQKGECVDPHVAKGPIHSFFFIRTSKFRSRLDVLNISPIWASKLLNFTLSHSFWGWDCS